MKKITSILGLIFIVLVFHLYQVFRSVDGVEIFESALTTQGPIEIYQYFNNVKLLINRGDLKALKSLIHANCGGGAGCYDHGKTIVQILDRLGDKGFSKIVQMLSPSDKKDLYGLLAVGQEYGGFAHYKDWKMFKNKNPSTFNYIENGYNKSLGSDAHSRARQL